MFGSDGSPIVQYIVIFAVIFAALAAIVFLVRRLTAGGLALPGRASGRGRQPRLGIVDVYELDRARQLILLRRDNVEHLLLVGGPNDVVIERNIQRGQRPLPEAALRPEPIAAPAPLVEPLPDPLAEAGRLPEPRRALPDSAGRRAEPRFDLGFEMPVVVPAPVPGSGAAPPVTLPLDAALLGGDEPGQDIAAGGVVAPAVPPPRAPSAASPAVPAAPGREALSPRRFLRRAAPQPDPQPATERPSEGAAQEPPPLAVPAGGRPVDPAILSDMARQLQAALARPASGVTPAPEASVVPVDTASMAPAQAAPAAEPEPPPAPPIQEAAPTPTPAASVEAPAEPPVPAPEPPAPEPQPEAKSAGNPFSVEEIEAEFARLLGRPLDKRG